MKVEEWIELERGWDDEVVFQGSAPDPGNSDYEFGLWFFNQEKHEYNSRHWALRLKYRKDTREVVAWHLQLWNPWRVSRDYPTIPPSTLPIVGETEHVEWVQEAVKESLKTKKK
jgi:hypothetical protein